MADPGETNEANAESTDPAQPDAAPAGGEGDVSVAPLSEGGPGREQAPPTGSSGDVATAGSPYWLASAETGAPAVHGTPEPPPAGPRPTAAPNPIAGIRTGGPPQGPGAADEPRRSSIVPRIAAVLVMLVFAAAVGYGLAFLSAQLVGQAGSSRPTVGAASAALSIAPGGTSAGAVSTTAPPASASSPGSAAASPSVAPRTTPAASARYHVVARGETLTSIAARYGVSVRALAAANGITDPNTIYAGQRLVIPGP